METVVNFEGLGKTACAWSWSAKNLCDQAVQFLSIQCQLPTFFQLSKLMIFVYCKGSRREAAEFFLSELNLWSFLLKWDFKYYVRLGLLLI
jgi:hypothetical protein